MRPDGSVEGKSDSGTHVGAATSAAGTASFVFPVWACIPTSQALVGFPAGQYTDQQLGTARRDLAQARFAYVLARVRLKALSGEQVAPNIDEVTAGYSAEKSARLGYVLAHHVVPPGPDGHASVVLSFV